MVRWLRERWKLRVVRFLAVAITCTLLQEAVLLILAGRFGVEKTFANGVGFAVSAQANFTLSAILTWGDRALDWSARHTAVRWVQFNSVAVAALLVNEGVFAIATHVFGAPIVAASILGVLVGALLTFKGNNGITFRRRKATVLAYALATTEQVPSVETVRPLTIGRTLVYFMPAYREGSNLPETVKATVTYLRQLLFAEFQCIIVNDGSPDNTGAIADELARAYAEVVVIHHEHNRGYGGALATGFTAAVAARTQAGAPFDLWAFSDADGQFQPESIGTLLVAQAQNDADLATGRRDIRESKARHAIGRAWHAFSGRMVGRDLLTVSDVDCGLKLGRVSALAAFAHKLFGQQAAISPELIARSKLAGHTIEERVVTYLPRLSGKSTGDNPRVMFLSGLHVLLIGIALRLERYLDVSLRLTRKPRGGATLFDGEDSMPFLTPGHRVPKTRTRDRVAWSIGIAATVLSIGAYVVTDKYHAGLGYGDAVSHLEIARRMIDGTSPGLAQLGGVWPPLPHLLELPLAWDNRFYFDGFAGSIVSMAAYVVTTVVTYKITYRLVDSKVAGFVGAAIFALCASMLYMQSTPMTESLLFCLLAIMVYCAQRWADTDRYQWLIGASIAALLATLTRYESWPILAVLLIGIAITAWRRRLSAMPKQWRRARARDRIILFVLPSMFAGIGGWMLWNWAIFGSPFAFQTGQYAQPSLWLTAHEPAIGNWWVSFKTYWYAMSDNITWPILLLAGLGLVYVLREIRAKRIPARRAAPTFALLVIVPFYVVSLYSGQRPLHVTPIESDLYNVRFGLVMLLPAAILAGAFMGFLIQVVTKRRFAVIAFGGVAIAGLLLLTGQSLVRHGPITYQEALGSQSPAAQTVAAAFERNYDGGLVLAQSFGNEGIVFHIPSNELVYEGSYQQWQPDLRSPSIHHIEWIVTRCGSDADEVCHGVNTGEYARYQLVWESPDGTFRIYHLKQQFQELAIGR